MQVIKIGDSEKALTGRVDIPEAVAYAYNMLVESISPNTKRAFVSDMNCFSEFCFVNGLSFEPASVVAVTAYLTYLERDLNFKPSTIQRRLATIAKFHKLKNFPSPTATQAVQDVMTAILKKHGSEQSQAKPAIVSDIKRGVDSIDVSTNRGKRNKALLLLGFSGGFRPSELAALKVSDIEFVSQGCLVHVRRGKGDRLNKGLTKTIHFAKVGKFCPVNALKLWKRVGELTDFVFPSIIKGDTVRREQKISVSTVSKIVKGTIGQAYSGHSLRVGCAVKLREAGMSLEQISDYIGFSNDMAKRYTKKYDRWKNEAGRSLGL